MTENWRIPTDFATTWNHQEKRLQRQERRPAVTNAAQILGPGAAPFAVLINDWNEEAATFVGVYYSEPGAVNAPDIDPLDPPGTTTNTYWIGETFGYSSPDDERYGFQRATQIRVPGDANGVIGTWTVYRRRFFPQGIDFTFTGWDEA